MFSSIELYAISTVSYWTLMTVEGGEHEHEHDTGESASGGPQKSRKRLAVALLVIAMIVLIMASASPAFPTSAQVSQAVMFSASVSPATAAWNQTIKVSLSDTNLLPFANSPSDDARYRELNLTGEPCGGTYPMGVALYQGRYTLQSLSSENYLPVVDVFSYYSCPLMSGAPFKLAPFWTDRQSMDLVGYWTAGETSHPGGGVSLGVLHPFPPGVYTLIAGDAWGHVQVLYFQIVS